MTHNGRTIPLTLSQRYLGDLLHLVQGCPSTPLTRSFPIAEVNAARQWAEPSPSWSAILLKAVALVSQSHSCLRQQYVSFPWPHLYEHPSTMAHIAVTRQEGDASILFPMIVPKPENLSIQELDAFFARTQSLEAEETPELRKMEKLARLPRPIRRLIWWKRCLSARLRAQHLGTVAVNVQWDGEPLTYSPLSVRLPTFTPLAITDGEMEVCFRFDPRVIDRTEAVKVLDGLQRAIQQDILSELRFSQRLAS